MKPDPGDSASLLTDRTGSWGLFAGPRGPRAGVKSLVGEAGPREGSGLLIVGARSTGYGTVAHICLRVGEAGPEARACSLVGGARAQQVPGQSITC